MARSHRAALPAKAALGVVLAASTLAIPAPLSHIHAAAALPPLVISDQLTGSWVRNFNPFIGGGGGALDPTQAGIYEPLYIFSFHDNAKAYPWLASGYQWSNGNKTLTFTIRQGVKWSDGTPFSADDVLFTLEGGHTNALPDQAGLWGANGLASDVTESGNTVSITFKKVNTTVLQGMANNTYIVPQHIWSTIKDPLHYTNPNPVGTGPFTQVENFSSQSYDVAKNPYYWQAGKPAVPVIRFTAHTGNDSALLDLKAGKIDWSGNFIPDVVSVYDHLNANFHHYYSIRSTPVQMYLNLTAYPYSLPAFRKALSMDINRMALANSAEYGYTIPADATGLGGQFVAWDNKALDGGLTAYNPTAAKALLKQAGFTWKGGALTDPRGHTVTFDINVVNGWTDWDADCTIMAQSFNSDLGIDAGVHQMAFGDWFNHLVTGNFVVQLSWSDSGATPYSFYYNEMSSRLLKPAGTANYQGANWGRYSNAAVDALLDQFSQTTDAASQRQIINKIQQIFVNQLPSLPLFYGPLWEDYNTTNYTGFPDAGNYYASGQPGDTPDRLLVLTNVHPAH